MKITARRIAILILFSMAILIFAKCAGISEGKLQRNKPQVIAWALKQDICANDTIFKTDSTIKIQYKDTTIFDSIDVRITDSFFVEKCNIDVILKNGTRVVIKDGNVSAWSIHKCEEKIITVNKGGFVFDRAAEMTYKRERDSIHNLLKVERAISKGAKAGKINWIFIAAGLGILFLLFIFIILKKK